MNADSDRLLKRLLAKQLAMNRQTWVALQSHGVTESTELCLDFAFVAPSRDRAEALQAELVDQTDYTVEVESAGDSPDKSWSVIGATKPTTVSAEILDQWVTWMITAGLQHECEFDGWGAEV